MSCLGCLVAAGAGRHARALHWGERVLKRAKLSGLNGGSRLKSKRGAITKVAYSTARFSTADFAIGEVLPLDFGHIIGGRKYSDLDVASLPCR